MEVGWAGLGRRGLINGRRCGPNTQLADLTKWSISSLPLFFFSDCVCPRLTGGEERGRGGGVIGPQGHRGCFQAHSSSLIKCDGKNVQRMDLF